MERNITNDKVTEYINQYYEAVTEGLAELRKQSEQEKVPIILKETESFLKVFLGITKPERILEIGCAVGYSSMFFNAACGAEVVTIEKSDEMYEKAVSNIKKLGFSDKITVLKGDGEEVMKLLWEQTDSENDGFDLVFIDAAKSHYKRFLEAALPLCRKNAVIIADNVLFKARVVSDEYDPAGKHRTNVRKLREFTDFINNDDRFETSVIACGDGISVTRLK